MEERGEDIVIGRRSCFRGYVCIGERGSGVVRGGKRGFFVCDLFVVIILFVGIGFRCIGV